MRRSLVLAVCCTLIACSHLRPKPEQAQVVVVNKSQRVLKLFRQHNLIKSYNIQLGRNPVGPKVKENDGKTPEGIYLIDFKNANSQYYLSLHFNYPNSQDKVRAKALGVKPGEDLVIHGVGDNQRDRRRHLKGIDWTNGCIALSNADMDDLWLHVGSGTPIRILP